MSTLKIGVRIWDRSDPSIILVLDKRIERTPSQAIKLSRIYRWFSSSCCERVRVFSYLQATDGSLEIEVPLPGGTKYGAETTSVTSITAFGTSSTDTCGL